MKMKKMKSLDVVSVKAARINFSRLNLKSKTMTNSIAFGKSLLVALAAAESRAKEQ
jgi:hypothetical protein